MPYIPQEQRDPLDEAIEELVHSKLSHGEMHYLITTLLMSRYTKDGYEDLQAALGLLEAVKLEFYRRVVAPYENKKRRLAGDVY